MTMAGTTRKPRPPEGAMLMGMDGSGGLEPGGPTGGGGGGNEEDKRATTFCWDVCPMLGEESRPMGKDAVNAPSGWLRVAVRRQCAGVRPNDDRRLPVLDRVLLGAARSARLQRVVTGAPVSRTVVRRFVAGQDVDTAVQAARLLSAAGLRVSIDRLGEDVTDTDQAAAATTAY